MLSPPTLSSVNQRVLLRTKRRDGSAEGRRRRAQKRRYLRLRPMPLTLEDRWLLSTFTVTSTADDGGTGTLRWAVGQANAATSPSTIDFQLGSAPATIALMEKELELSNTSSAITIDGPGADLLSISGSEAGRVFRVDKDVTATISGLTIADGLANSSASGAYFDGGGLYNKGGTVTLDDCTISGNTSGRGGGIDNYSGTATLDNCTLTGNSATDGAAIENDGTATLTGCTISGNSIGSHGGNGVGLYNYDGTVNLTACTISGNTGASGVFGGGVENEGTAILTNCTISSNSAGFAGGGMMNFNGTATLTACTISGNSAPVGGGLYNRFSSSTSTVALTDTIVAGNAGSDIDDVEGATTTGSYNLVGTGGAGGLTSAGHNLIGVADPGLAPLANYGGPTETMALLPDSPAISAGTAVSGVTTDQRGDPLDSPPDIGAFQTQPSDVWTGQGSNNLWSNPDNWQGDAAPTANSALLFPSGANTLTNVDDLGYTFSSVTIQDKYSISGPSLDVTGDLTVMDPAVQLGCATMTDSGKLVVGPGCILTLSQNTNLADVEVQAGGTLTISTTAAVNITGAAEADQGSIMNINGSVTMPSGATLLNGGTLNVGDSGSVDIQSNATVACGPNAQVNVDGTISGDGSYLCENTANTSGGGTVDVANTTVDPNANFTVTTTTDPQNGSVNDDGNISVPQGGDLNVQQGGDLNVQQGGDVNVQSGGDVNDAGAVTDGDGITVATGGTMVVTGTLTEAAGGSLQISGTVSLEPSSTLTDQSRVTVEAGGLLKVYGNLSIPASGSLDIFGAVLMEPGSAYSPLGTVTVEPGGSLKHQTSLAAVSGAGAYAAGTTLTATLAADGRPVAGEPVSFTIDESGNVTSVGTVTTDAAGVAILPGVSLLGFNAGTFNGAVGASFAGDSADAGSSTSGNLTVNPAEATLALSGLTFIYDGAPHTSTVSTAPQGLAGVTVTYTEDGVAVAAPTQAGSYSVTATLDNPNYTAASVTGTLFINPAMSTPTQTVVIGEQPLFQRERNKKGKPTGKAVQTGFTLDFGVPLNAAAASNAAKYQVATLTNKKVKKKKETTLHPITRFTVSYLAASDTVEIMLGAKETFPTGGQITVLGGLTTASGGTLSGPAVFAISKGGKRIGPA
jgi:hypothetical protein